MVIRSNPAVWDPRVEKEVRSLTTHGFRVTILALDREGLYPRFESSGNRLVFRLRLRMPYGKSVMFAYYPIFWLWTLSKLLEIHPSIIHACDLDSVFPALLYRFLRHRTRVVFDVFDSLALSIRGKSQVLSDIVLCVEKFVAAMPDALITVSKERLALYDGVKLKRSEIIMNFPDLEGFREGLTARYLDRPSKVFRLVYAGMIWPYRGLVETAEAIKDISDIEFVLAGRIMSRKVFDSVMRFPQAKYYGQLEFRKSLALESSADAIVVLYDLNSPTLRFSGVAPNKLYEAMMLGVPVVTNLADSLRGVKFGVFVKYGDVDSTRKAILYLKEHPDVRHRLGANGKRAFEQTYNWTLMEKRLLALYHGLLDQVQSA